MRAARRTTIVLLGLLAAAATILALQSRSPLRVDPLSEPAASGALSTELTSEPENVVGAPEDATEYRENARQARRIVQVPDTRKTRTEPELVDFESVRGANIAQLAAGSADKALQGDLHAARNLTGLMTICRHLVPADEETLELEIQRATDMAKTSASLGDPIPAEGQSYTSMWFNSVAVGVKVFPTEAQNRGHLTEWFRGCRNVDKVFDEGMRKELEGLARSGHVMARYLYAMWRPPLSVDKDALEQRMQWQINAFEFSYANLEEGEVAGLLAFSQTFIEGIFTGVDIGLSLSMAKAALECGYESDEIRQTVERFTDDSNTESLRRWAGITPAGFDALVAAFAERCR